MAHVVKYTKVQAGHLGKHFKRAKDEQGQYLKFGNQDIDPARTPQNYNLGPEHEQGQMDFIQQRCDEVFCMNRKDVNVMGDWLVTAPDGIANSEYEQEFFQNSYNFLAEKYGKENVISAYVHKDETTPHMHFAFVPVVYDKKRNRLKVSAKECLTINHLKTFHDELDRHLKKTMGEHYQGGILNQATKDGNQSIEELKRATATEKLQELRQAEQEAARIAQRERDRVKGLQGEIRALQAKLEGLQGQVVTSRGLESIKPEKTLMGALRGITVQQVQDLKKTAVKYHEVIGQNKHLQQEYKKLKQDYAKLQQMVPTMDQRLEAAQMEAQSKQDIKDLESQLQEVYDFIAKIPDDVYHQIEREIHQANQENSPRFDFRGPEMSL